MRLRARSSGFTLLELTISLALVTALLVILVPALASARVISYREQCASNQRVIGQAWLMYLDAHRETFPYVAVLPGWRYGGVRFTSFHGQPILDTQRPLTPYVPYTAAPGGREGLFRCPADQGITGETEGVGTAGRTAYQAYGTSFRANARLLDASLAGIPYTHRGLRRFEITTAPSRLMVMGEPIWYEIYESTGRDAAWHGEKTRGNLLFLDGSVRYKEILPKHRVGPVVYEPKLAEAVISPPTKSPTDPLFEPGDVP
jgi:prepilin-type processing-associated H-X9-DG protein